MRGGRRWSEAGEKGGEIHNIGASPWFGIRLRRREEGEGNKDRRKKRVFGIAKSREGRNKSYCDAQ